MTKRKLATVMEWLRPIGIAIGLAVVYGIGADAATQFHILAPIVVLLVAGTTAFESLWLGEVASEKIGYAANRAYQIQSALNNLALAVVALVVLVLNWGLHAEAAVVLVLLTFFVLSACNHLRTAIREGNRKITNLLRPVMALLLLAAVLPPMIMALTG